MKLTNGEIFASREPLEALLQMKFPVAISFKLAKTATKVNEALKVIEGVRNGLINRYGAPNDLGQMWVAPNSENFELFVKEFNDLLAIEVEVAIDKVKLPEEVDGLPFEVEPSLLMALEKFVTI